MGENTDLNGSDAHLTGDQKVAGSISARSNNTFVETDHGVPSMIILYLQMSQEGHLSVSGKRMCTSAS